MADASIQLKLDAVRNFDLLGPNEQDYVASIVAKDKGRRVRDISDEEVLNYHKDLLKQIFNDNCDTDIEAGFTSAQNGYFYRTNRDDQINFIGEFLMLKEDYTVTTVYWKTEDAGIQPVTREQFFMIYQEALNHKNNTIKKYWTKKNEIDACTTHKELRDMTWEDDVTSN